MSGRGLDRDDPFQCPTCGSAEERVGKSGKPYLVCRCPSEMNSHPTLHYGLKQAAWKRISRAVIARDGNRCAYCGTTVRKMQCDHVVPWTRGGTNDESNLVAACIDCNRSKKNKLVSEWRRPQ